MLPVDLGGDRLLNPVIQRKKGCKAGKLAGSVNNNARGGTQNAGLPFLRINFQTRALGLDPPEIKAVVVGWLDPLKIMRGEEGRKMEYSVQFCRFNTN